MKTTDRRSVSLLGLVLVVGTLFCFRNLPRHQFSCFDDRAYIIANAHVLPGVTWAGVVWAFKTGYACNWHPVTWISHMADCSLYGLNPHGHHFTNLLFHCANVILLFLLLRRLTGALWRSFLVAAFWAWHPLHVESVAWAAERKDVLSAFFFLLTLLSYKRYAEALAQGSPGRPLAFRLYFLCLLLFALGLMSKPMLVTLPFVLALMDFWPMGRCRIPGVDFRSLRPLLLEKLPFCVLSFGASIVTFFVQREGGAVSSLQIIPLSLRCSNAIVAYSQYVLKTLWPSNLSIIYPFPNHLPVVAIVGSLLLMTVMCWFSVRMVSKRPYLVTGWFWFLGTLVPVIGLVQVGAQAMADRYTYLPSIGLFIILVWGATELAGAFPGLPRLAAPAASVAALSACVLWTSRQVDVWQTSETLFRHAVGVTQNNYAALDGLANALDESGRSEEGMEYHIESVRIAPTFAQGQFNLGTALLARGELQGAIDHLKSAVALAPCFADAHHSLGTALLKAGVSDQAAACFVTALRLKPDDADAHHAFGNLLLSRSETPAAVREFSEALRLNPSHLEARRNLGVALAQLGRIEDAACQFRVAVQIAPNDPEVRFMHGLALSDLNRPAEAALEFSEAIKLNPKDPKNHYRLARAFARQHLHPEAIAQYRESLALFPEFPEALGELAWLLATVPDPALRSGHEAVTLAEQACSLTKPEQPNRVLILSAAYAEAGRLADARAALQKARNLAQIQGQEETISRAEILARAFEAGQPYRENL